MTHWWFHWSISWKPRNHYALVLRHPKPPKKKHTNFIKTSSFRQKTMRCHNARHSLTNNNTSSSRSVSRFLIIFIFKIPFFAQTQSPVWAADRTVVFIFFSFESRWLLFFLLYSSFLFLPQNSPPLLTHTAYGERTPSWTAAIFLRPAGPGSYRSVHPLGTTNRTLPPTRTHPPAADRCQDWKIIVLHASGLCASSPSSRQK